MKTPDNQFGKWFREWRTDHGISNDSLSKNIGIHQSYISNIEGGRRGMSRNTARQIAENPGIPIDYKTIMAWRIRAEYTPEEIQEAYKQGKESQ